MQWKTKQLGLVFAVTVQLDWNKINIDGQDLNLTGGMNVTAEIKTGRRRVIDYLLSPLLPIPRLPCLRPSTGMAGSQSPFGRLCRRPPQPRCGGRAKTTCQISLIATNQSRGQFAATTCLPVVQYQKQRLEHTGQLGFI